MDDKLKKKYDSGREAFNSGKLEEARIELSQFAEKMKGFADVHNMLGLIAHNQGRFNDAISEFEQALSINPRYTEAALNLAVTYNDTGQYDKANEAYALTGKPVAKHESVVDADAFARGKLANMHCEIADVYMSMAEHERAITEYGMALDLQPNFADIRMKLGVAQREAGHYDDAITTLRKAVEVNPRWPGPKLHLGLAYYCNGANDRAIDIWNKVLETNPDHQNARAYIKMVEEKLGQS